MSATPCAPHDGDSHGHGAVDIPFDDVSVDSHGTERCNGSRTGLSKEEREVLAQRESKVIFYLRLLVVLVLVSSAIGVSMAVHTYMYNDETEAFHSQLESDSQKILEGIADAFDNTLGAADEFALKLVSHARYANMTWPFCTFPDFTVQGMKLLKRSNAFWMSLFQIVHASQRDAWQKYASENEAWIAQSLELHANDPDYKGLLITNYSTIHELYGYAGVIEKPSPFSNNSYLPSWQRAPVIPIPFAYNYDGYSDPILAPDIAYATKAKRVLIASAFQNVLFDPEDPIEARTVAATNAWTSSYLGPGEDPAQPSSAVGYPIIDQLDQVRLDVTKDLPIVGFLNFQLFWRDMIKEILPPNSIGLILVIETECLQRFVTFRIDGPTVTFLGTGDLHDPKYDSLRIVQSLPSLMSTSNPNRDSSYTGLPLDEYCQKILHVYPSEEMEAQYKTNGPIIFTVCAGLIFLFASFVFLAYDLVVAYRQKIVLQRAHASSAIVSSLFPEQVRQQLYKESEEKQLSASGIKQFASTDGIAAKSSRPIADEFENTTIYFADLVGFTSWSASRTPTEVFELLEALYASFDRIAARRRVFKVETIGDCYVAVTGIPHAQEDHAVIMVKFAEDCKAKMTEVIQELVDSLGADTADLRMRIGLHSGSTTAGVLRGEKGRFQLFGDTVNTASRMESNGVPNRIHVSQATADALILKGKGHWLTPREDKITAKGKGLMQTYFVTPTKSDRSVASASWGNTSSHSSQEATYTKDVVHALSKYSFGADAVDQEPNMNEFKEDKEGPKEKPSSSIEL